MTTRLKLAACLFVLGGGIATASIALTPRREPVQTDRPSYGEIRRVVSGHKVKLESGEPLTYAGIRAPYPHEPWYARAKQRNKELVEGREVRLRFDEVASDRKGRMFSYVSVGTKMVNELLVREGLAYVRLTPQTLRFAERLLAAQSDARSDGIGIWEEQPSRVRGSYSADPKYGAFHRPGCAIGDVIKPERLIKFKKKSAAFDAGFAPCPKCRP